MEYNIIDDDSSTSTSTSENDELHDMGSEEEVDFIGQLDDLDVDQVMAAGVTATNPNGVDVAHHSKIWRISAEDTKRTLAVTSQHGQCAQDPMLSQNYGTNDRMLWYQHIHEHFFMDTFFTTSKGGKSTRGNTCCQLFVTDKVYLYVVPMKCKGKVLQAIKQFTKEIGVPDAIVSNMAKEQLSQEVKHFCNLIVRDHSPSFRGGNTMVQLSGTLHQVDERSHSQRYVGDGLTDGSVGLLSRVPGQDLQPYGSVPLQGLWN